MRMSVVLAVGLLLSPLGCTSDPPATGGGTSNTGGAPAAGGTGGAPSGQGGGGGGSASGGSGGSGGTSASTGGTTGAGGTPSPVVEPGPSMDAAVDNRPVGDVGPADAARDAGVDGGGLTSKDFVCSWVLGITTTGEWYRAGFEQVVDNARWQVTPIEMGHLEKWADPAHEIWNSAISSPCARNSRMPDRIVFMATKYEWTTLQEFIPAYVSFVNNIKTKYPTVKR
ncbi:MAG TPA: hypothetical protein VGF45_00385, partial [Polyangia bacterium]